MKNSESLNQIQLQEKLAAFEMAATWMPGIKILQQVEPLQNLFICEEGIKRYGISPAFFRHLPIREFEKLIFHADHPDTCLLGIKEGKFPAYPEVKLYLQHKGKGQDLSIELVVVKNIQFDAAGVPILILTQILPLCFHSWTKTKVNRIIHEMDFKKQNYTKFNQLTQRNKEVLTHMVSCNKAEEISDKLDISVNTVNTHKKKIKDLLVLEESHELLWYGLAFDMLNY